MILRRTLPVFLLALVFVLACRAQDFVAQFRSTATPPPIAAIVPTATPLPPTQTSTATLTTTPTPEPGTSTPTPVSPTATPSTLPSATSQPTALPTQTALPPTRAPTITPTLPPTGTFTPAPPPSPTRCPDKYCVAYHGCQPDGGNTVVEGRVLAEGVPENGVYVRVALEPGAFPLIDDFASGTDPINPGKSDPANPGRFILQIVPGQPREGNWWVFIVDKPKGTIRLSEALFIHTNDSPAAGNCQHAFVDFIR